MIELEEDLKEIYGYMGIDTTVKAEEIEDVEVCGYPGDKERHTMWSAHGPTKKYRELLAYTIPTMHGQSGAPIIKRNGDQKEFIIGIHIGSVETKNYGVPLSPEKREKINQWVG